MRYYHDITLNVHYYYNAYFLFRIPKCSSTSPITIITPTPTLTQLHYQSTLLPHSILHHFPTTTPLLPHYYPIITPLYYPTTLPLLHPTTHSYTTTPPHHYSTITPLLHHYTTPQQYLTLP